MRLTGSLFRFPPQVFVENDIEAVPGLAIKKCSRRDLDSEHLLQTDRLGAELDFVAVVYLGLAPLVLHRKRKPGTIRLPMELHNVSLSYQPEPKRPERHSSLDPDVAPGFAALVVNPFMHDPTLGGEKVFGPNPFNMNQSTSTRAV